MKADNNINNTCKFVIEYCKRNGIYLQPLKLHKLLYLIQVYYIKFTRGQSACFDDVIVAWTYGPVVKSIYEIYCTYGMYTVNKCIEVGGSRYGRSIKKMLVNKDIIEYVLEKYADKNAMQLIMAIQKTQPWIDAYEQGSGTIITKESIYNFYRR